jgi:hypothetical protein
MAFTVTVIDREDLEMMGGRACDQCLGCDVGAGGAQVDDTVSAKLSPLED